jgi:hypothetical protein
MNEKEHGQKGLAIFASNEHDFFKAYKLGMPVEDLMVVDASPYETFNLRLLSNL